MASKLNIPSVVGLGADSIPFGITVFLQAVEDALKTLDRNVVYKDSITVNINNPKLRALSAQGQSFSVSGTNLASGEDHSALVQNTAAILEDLNALRNEVATLKAQLQGS